MRSFDGSLRLRGAAVLAAFGAAASVACLGGDPGKEGRTSCRVLLDGPGDTGKQACEVVQVLGPDGEPGAYFMDVGSVVCGEAKCEVVPVRLYFDTVGNYQRYELPPGRNLTKLGHQPFSREDHEKLHQILSDPYSALKSIDWGQITVPKGGAGPGGRREELDGVSGATVLSKRSVVVVGAAYTCCTLWHWSHGEVVKVIREMTIRASDQQDWLRALGSEKDADVVFAIDQLASQKRFDGETINAVLEVLRGGSVRRVDPALRFLDRASAETGVDCFYRCCEEACLAESSEKRVRFLEALRERDGSLPASCVARLGSWVARADSYYEVHLLLTLLEREKAVPDEAMGGAIALLENSNALVVRRSYRFLKAQNLKGGQQKKLEEFEAQHPDA